MNEKIYNDLRLSMLWQYALFLIHNSHIVIEQKEQTPLFLDARSCFEILDLFSFVFKVGDGCIISHLIRLLSTFGTLFEVSKQISLGPGLVLSKKADFPVICLLDWKDLKVISDADSAGSLSKLSLKASSESPLFKSRFLGLEPKILPPFCLRIWLLFDFLHNVEE